METRVSRTDDFQVTGDGASSEWRTAAELPLFRVGEFGDSTYATSAKVLYSDTGIYFHVECQDRILTCTKTEDFDDIYEEDVVEVFLWPDESQPLYFEYELSPLDVELPILIPNHGGRFMGWRPWHYEGDRRVQHATSIRGGKRESMAEVDGWSAEFYIPFSLFTGLGGTPPTSGTVWRANIYRIDYDDSPASHWAWCPDTGANFHRYQEFGKFLFEE